MRSTGPRGRTEPSPTHVGMDRVQRRHPRAAGSEPHARGDGPVYRVDVSGESVPSPTHVGMDRFAGICAASTTPEPHARGDGPDELDAVNGPARRAPRTWGWTVRTRPRTECRSPSPTHVGMDRRRAACAAASSPEPHARGDGPSVRVTPSGEVSRAPRTWGWTDWWGGRVSARWPSPTHVGMDRPPAPAAPAPPAEPHARGDGPGVCVALARTRTRAPRTWGWTALVGMGEVLTEPSPTHVGMDRANAPGRWLRSAEPHARGDGPSASDR